jgi:hypothetical protein
VDPSLTGGPSPPAKDKEVVLFPVGQGDSPRDKGLAKALVPVSQSELEEEEEEQVLPFCCEVVALSNLPSAVGCIEIGRA